MAATAHDRNATRRATSRCRTAPRALAALAVVATALAGCGVASGPVTGARTQRPVPPTVASGSTQRAATQRAATLPAVAATAARPCLGTAAPRRYAHVIWIVMENKSYASALGASAPATRALAARCGIASGYHGVTHPSLPNYLAMTSGSTHGVRNDANPSAHRIAGSSIFSQVAAARLRWATYAESMPTLCRRTSSGRYAVRHNPAAYYTALARTCARSDVAMGTTTRGPLLTAIRTGRLPAFTLMVPNLCSDTHDCSVATGDRWLARWLAVILSSRTYAAGRTAVFITWDEDDNSHANRVALLMVAPSVRPHTVVRGTYNHVNLLRTTEDMLGLPALVRRAASLRRPAHL